MATNNGGTVQAQGFIDYLAARICTIFLLKNKIKLLILPKVLGQYAIGMILIQPKD